MSLDSDAHVSENDQGDIYVPEVSLLQFARSGLFLWHTLEFLLVGSAEIFLLIRYWDKLTEMHVVVLVCVVGITLTVGPYLSFVVNCRWLNGVDELCKTPNIANPRVLKATVEVARSGLSRLMTSCFGALLILVSVLVYSLNHAR